MKRSAPDTAVAAAPSASQRRATGIAYLMQQYGQIKPCEFGIAFDDMNGLKWNVAAQMPVLSQRLQDQLAAWSHIAQAPAEIVFEITFPKTFPTAHPFVRIVRPRFRYRTGHVTVGGSICTSLLTAQGWERMDIQSLLYSLVGILEEGGAVIQTSRDIHCTVPFVDYTEYEARDAHRRMLQVHGW